MRRILSLLLVLLMAAASAAASPVVCITAWGGVTANHDCCDDEGPVVAPAPMSCCALAPVPAQPGPASSRFTSPGIAAALDVVRQPVGPPRETSRLDAPPRFIYPAIPLYLQQLALLI
jgi:hypothetical protein